MMMKFDLWMPEWKLFRITAVQFIIHSTFILKNLISTYEAKNYKNKKKLRYRKLILKSEKKTNLSVDMLFIIENSKNWLLKYKI